MIIQKAVAAFAGATRRVVTTPHQPNRADPLQGAPKQASKIGAPRSSSAVAQAYYGDGLSLRSSMRVASTGPVMPVRPVQPPFAVPAGLRIPGTGVLTGPTTSLMGLLALQNGLQGLQRSVITASNISALMHRNAMSVINNLRPSG